MKTRWLDALRAAGLGHHIDALAPLIRNTIALVPRDARAEDERVGASRLGGTPDLPADVEWPADREGPIPFVAQLDLAAVAPFDVDRALPREGVLSFFCGFGEDGDRSAVLHLSPAALEPRAAPPSVETEAVRGVDFTAKVELPPYSSQFVAIDTLGSSLVPMPVADHILYAKVYEQAEAEWNGKRHALLGYGRAMENELSSDQIILLRLDDDGTIGHMWNEAAVLYFTIDREALARGELRAARGSYGATI